MQRRLVFIIAITVSSASCAMEAEKGEPQTIVTHTPTTPRKPLTPVTPTTPRRRFAKVASVESLKLVEERIAESLELDSPPITASGRDNPAQAAEEDNLKTRIAQQLAIAQLQPELAKNSVDQ